MAVLATLALSAQAPARDPARARGGTSIIRGRVVAAAGEPIRKVRLTIAGGSAHEPIFSDGDGRFAFTGLGAGHYVITAEKTGFARSRYGATGPLDPPVTIHLAADSVVTGVDLLMPRSAAISGRVADDLLDPQVGMTVIASRVLRAGGRLRLEPAAYAQTDDLGEYRLSGLAEGRYVVDASTIPVTEAGISSGGIVSIGGFPPGAPVFGRTYYPGVAVLAEAQALVVRAGDDLDGVDFTLAPAVTPTVSLSVTDDKGEPAVGPFNIVPVPTYSALARSGVVAGGQATARVEPGEWVVSVRGAAGAAFAPITVGADDVAVRLVLTQGGTLSGRVIVEGAGMPPGVELEAVPLEGEGAPFALVSARASVGADRSFTIKGLVGSRELRLRTAPPGWRIKSLRAGTRDLLDGPLEIAGGESVTGAVLTLTAIAASVRGVVTDGTMPVAAASVLAFPQDRSRWRLPARWTRWVKTDGRGAFAIDDLPAGEYFMIAPGEVDATSWSSNDALERLMPRATRVTTTDGQTRTVSLNLVAAP